MFKKKLLKHKKSEAQEPPSRYPQPAHHIQEYGYAPVPAYNAYWDERGLTFEDPDGYRVVLERAE